MGNIYSVLIHNVGVVLAALAVLFGVTVIVPVAFTATSTCQWNTIVECP
jgi:Zn-dependent membrane protease YugP